MYSDKRIETVMRNTHWASKTITGAALAGGALLAVLALSGTAVADSTWNSAPADSTWNSAPADSTWNSTPVTSPLDSRWD